MWQYELSMAARQVTEAAIQGATLRLRFGWFDESRTHGDPPHALHGCPFVYAEVPGRQGRVLTAVIPNALFDLVDVNGVGEGALPGKQGCRL